MTMTYKNLFTLALMALVGLWTVSCSGDEDSVAAPLASFQFSVSSENALTVNFIDQSKDGETYVWDFGDGSGTSAAANPSYTYASGGTYDVTLTVSNEGGSDESTKSVTVIDPSAQNLIANGSFDDDSEWTILQLWTNTENAVNHAITGGEVKFENATGTVFSQALLYQGVELEAGSNYAFSADVRGDGITNGWFEVYFTTSAPTNEELGQMHLFLKGYGENENCASSAFSGEIFDVVANGCPLPEGSKFSASGTFAVTAEDLNENNELYLVFKVGTWDGSLGAGVYMDNVTLTKVD